MENFKEQQIDCECLAREIWDMTPYHEQNGSWESHLRILIALSHDQMLRDIHAELKRAWGVKP